jgi:hypothetical protein
MPPSPEQLQPGPHTIEVDAANPLPDFNPAQSYIWTFVMGQNVAGFSAPDFTVEEPRFANGTFSVISDGRSLSLEFTAGARGRDVRSRGHYVGDTRVGADGEKQSRACGECSASPSSALPLASSHEAGTDHSSGC